jgi:stringent starvation protein B
MKREPLHHPIQAAIEDIWNAGHTPRIQLDARRPDVVVPESVRTKWGARLVLDLDASWPLELETSEEGLEVSLAFQGVVTRCTLPWESIYVVLDRSTGRGIVIESHMPADGAGEAPKEEEPTAPRPSLQRAGAPRAVASRSELPRAGASRSELPRAGAPRVEQAEPQRTGAGARSTASDEDARLRRSRFKVIDGGQ